MAMLTEAEPNFQEAVNIATAREVAELVVRKMGGWGVFMLCVISLALLIHPVVKSSIVLILR